MTESEDERIISLRDQTRLVPKERQMLDQLYIICTSAVSMEVECASLELKEDIRDINLLKKKIYSHKREVDKLLNMTEGIRRIIIKK